MGRRLFYKRGAVMSRPGVPVDHYGTIIAACGYTGPVDRVEFRDRAIDAIRRSRRRAAVALEEGDMQSLASTQALSFGGSDPAGRREGRHK